MISMKWNLNSPIMVAMGQIADIILCNILFCLFSLPIFTIGASLSALYSCMQYLIDDNDENDEGNILRKFWDVFKENFWKGTLLWLLSLSAFLFLGVYYLVVSSLEGPLGKLYKISFFVLCLVFLVGYQYLFPMQARYENRIRDTLKNAWMLGIAALPWTLLSIMLVVAVGYASFFMNLGVIFWAVGGFGLVAYVNSLFFRQGFRKWRADEGPKRIEGELPEEALFIDERHQKRESM